MRTMNIGKLNKRVKILKLNDVTDELGQSTKKLAEFKTVWATFYTVRGAEFYEIQKIESSVTHKCYIRYLEGVDTACYIDYKGTIYTIKSVVDIDLEHKMLELMCVEYNGKEVIDYDG